MEVAKLLNVEISPEQISTSHRIASRTNKHKDNESQPHLRLLPDSSIVMFVTNFITIASWLTIWTSNDFQWKERIAFSLMKILTQARKKLFWMVKQKAKLADYKYFHTMNGNIYTRKHNDSNALIIKRRKRP